MWKYISIDGRYFYCVLRRIRRQSAGKKITNVFVEFDYFTEAATVGILQKGVFKNFAIFTGKHPYWSLVAGLQFCNFIKKRLQH